MSLNQKFKSFLGIYLVHPIQRFFRGWSYSDIWNLNTHLAEIICPRLKAFIKSYRSGKFHGLCPGMIIQNYKNQLLHEGHIWDENRHFFSDSKAESRLQEIWLEILESMLFSFEWVANGEPIPPDCYKPNPLYEPQAGCFIPAVNGTDYLNNPKYGSEAIDEDAYDLFTQKIQKGFDNFAKYYQCLWD